MTEQFEIGIITSTHGLKGEVKVFPTTDDVNRFSTLKDVLLETGDAPLHLTVERVRFFKGRPILKFCGFDRIEDVEKFHGKKLLVSREDAVPLGENEHYIGDILGSRVYLKDGSSYGVLRDVLKTGANDVFEILKEDGSLEYLPSIRDVVLSIDPEAKKITVAPMRVI